MRAKPVLAVSGAIVAAGFLFGIGLRASQWLVPAPPEQLALCAADQAPSSDGACVLLEDATDAPAAQHENVDAELAPSSLRTI